MSPSKGRFFRVKASLIYHATNPRKRLDDRFGCQGLTAMHLAAQKGQGGQLGLGFRVWGLVITKLLRHIRVFMGLEL